MERAADHARNQDIEVELLSAQFAEDRSVVPKPFRKTPDLKSSILDVFEVDPPRKLPFIREILDRLNCVDSADLAVFTNVDIGVVPHFYVALDYLYRSGLDGIIINRRTVPASIGDVDDLPLLMSHVGEPHPGRDCFVFRPEAVDDFVVGDVVVGTDGIGRVLLWNVVLTAKAPEWFWDLHLTFHLGDDRAWSSDRQSPYIDFNAEQLESVRSQLEEVHGPLHQNPLLRGYSYAGADELSRWRQLVRQVKRMLR